MRQRERERQTVKHRRYPKLLIHFYLFTPQWMSTTQGNVLETEVMDYAVKSKKKMVQKQALDTAIRLKQNVTYVKAAVVKVVMVVLVVLREM